MTIWLERALYSGPSALAKIDAALADCAGTVSWQLGILRLKHANPGTFGADIGLIRIKLSGFPLGTPHRGYRNDRTYRNLGRR